MSSVLPSVQSGLESLTEDMDSVKAQLTAFIDEDRLARNMQFAQTALIDVREERDRQFGHYADVRRGTIGMLQALDIGIVTESALRQAAERLMLRTPGYWLAPAQVALAAWIRDDEACARRALLEAVSRDADKTSLTFGLALARHDRFDAASQWMREYIDRQDPLRLSREFTVVLDAAAQGALGSETLDLIKERCTAWFARLRTAEDITQVQTQRWLRRMNRNRRRLRDTFTVLPRISPELEEFSEWLESTTVHEQTQLWLEEQLAETVELAVDRRQRVDGVLRSLITSYDDEEGSLRQQEMKWAAVVTHGGDHAEAERARASSSPTDDSRTNFLALITTIGISPESTDASVPTRQLAIRLATEWIKAAAHLLSLRSRDREPSAIRVEIEGWAGELPLDGDHKPAAHSLRRLIEQDIDRELKATTVRKPATAFTGAATTFVVSLVALGSRWLPTDPALVVTFLAIVLVMGTGLWLYRAMLGLPARRAEVQARGKARMTRALADLEAAAGEAREARALGKSLLAKERSLKAFLDEQSAAAGQPFAPVAAHDSPPPSSRDTSDDRPAPDDRPSPTEGQPIGDETIAFTLPRWNLLPPTLRNDRESDA